MANINLNSGQVAGRYWNPAGRQPVQQFQRTQNNRVINERGTMQNQKLRGLAEALSGLSDDPTQAEIARVRRFDPGTAETMRKSGAASAEQVKKARAEDIYTMYQYANSGDIPGAIAAGEERVIDGLRMGLDMGQTESIVADLKTRGKAAVPGLGHLVKVAWDQGYIGEGNRRTSGQRELESLLAQLPKDQHEAAIEYAAGLRGRPTEAITLAGDADLAGTVAAQAGKKAGSVEEGKLTSQMKLKPAVDAAVATAVAAARDTIGIKQENRSNDRAFQLYETSMRGLETAMGNTATGSVVGSGWAFTENQQIADGAVSMMLPLLKAMFRSAGEGTFTEGDQKILTDLVPTRKDGPGARAAKIAAMDAIIRQKLAPHTPISGDFQKLTDDDLLGF